MSAFGVPVEPYHSLSIHVSSSRLSQAVPELDLAGRLRCPMRRRIRRTSFAKSSLMDATRRTVQLSMMARRSSMESIPAAAKASRSCCTWASRIGKSVSTSGAWVGVANYVKGAVVHGSSSWISRGSNSATRPCIRAGRPRRGPPTIEKARQWAAWAGPHCQIGDSLGTAARWHPVWPREQHSGLASALALTQRARDLSVRCCNSPGVRSDTTPSAVRTRRIPTTLMSV